MYRLFEGRNAHIITSPSHRKEISIGQKVAPKRRLVRKVLHMYIFTFFIDQVRDPSVFGGVKENVSGTSRQITEHYILDNKSQKYVRLKYHIRNERNQYMGKIDIAETMRVNASAEKAWEVIGPNFVNIGDWGPGIFKSWKNESLEATIPDAPAGGRFCDLGKSGVFDERILHYDKSTYEITWSANGEKLPGFVRDLQNALKVEKIDYETCRISTNITATTAGIAGALLGGVVQKNFAGSLTGFLEAWKLYAETGKVTEAKQKELAAATA